MDDLIIISNLNDFIFCPASIYFHNLYGSEDKLMFQSDYQLNGSKANEAVDKGTYSTKKNIITNLDIYSEKYRIIGKIDIYDKTAKKIIERKKHIIRIYDGYIFQMYAQYFAMTEMGYQVEELEMYSMDDNKKYKISLPEQDEKMKKKFEETVFKLRTFNLEEFQQTNEEKCKKCIYETACDRAIKRSE